MEFPETAVRLITPTQQLCRQKARYGPSIAFHVFDE